MILPVNQIVELLLQYKYLLLFPFTIIEGPIITILAGFLASHNILNFFLAYAIVVAGDMVGDTAYYWTGRIGGHKFLRKWGQRLGVSKHKVEQMIKTFHDKKEARWYVAGKFAHGVGTSVLLVAGMTKVKFGRFFLINLAITLPKSMILLLVGYFFGEAYATINLYLNDIALAGLIIAALLAVFLLAWKYFTSRIK